METSVSTLPSSAARQHATSGIASGQHDPAPQPEPATVQIRPLKREDARALHALVCACPPLDVNSLYAYALLALHHTSTCFVAVRDGQLCGAVTGYVKPSQPDTYFLWQIAIAPNQQGSGLGSALLDHVARYCLQQQNLQFLETTISPGNAASQRLFGRFAQRHQVACQQRPLLSSEELQAVVLPETSLSEQGLPPQELCPPAHEAEDLYRIGPW